MRRLTLPKRLHWHGAGRRGRARPRVVPWWRTPRGRAVKVVLPLLALAVVVLWGWQARWPERAGAWAEATIDDALRGLGFGVSEVWVVGRSRTPREDLIAALDVETGDVILDVDLAALRDRVRALSWVRDASVRRVLPETLVIRIQERQPLARWQHEGRFALIDATGTVLTRRGLERFADLPLVVGGDAPPHAEALIAMLRSEPALYRQARAAVRFGKRRWNVHLDNGVVVRLPERDPAAAWQRLAEYQRRHDLLDQDIRMLDLRFAGRIIVRPRQAPAHPPTAAGRDT